MSRPTIIACIFEKALGGDQVFVVLDGVNCQVMFPLCPGCTVSNPSRQQVFVLGKGALRRWVWSPPAMRIILRRSASRLRKLRAVRR